jgi:hypothetical protein
MTRATFTIAVAFLCSAAAAAPLVTYESACECRDNHGKHRWAEKNDAALPPMDVSAIHAVTPSDIFGWPGPEVHLTGESERTGIENRWFALTGRVVAVKVEGEHWHRKPVPLLSVVGAIKTTLARSCEAYRGSVSGCQTWNHESFALDFRHFDTSRH